MSGDMERREVALQIARKLMVDYFGPGKSSATPADWVIDAMLAFASHPASNARQDEGTVV